MGTAVDIPACLGLVSAGIRVFERRVSYEFTACVSSNEFHRVQSM